MESTFAEDAVLDEAFAAFVQAREKGDVEAARKLLADHAGLAEQAAMHYAFCPPLPEPWPPIDLRPGTLNDPGHPDTPPAQSDWPKVPGYEILAELGRGAMGVVYKAWQVGLKRFVALKMIRAGALADRDQKERFRREAEAVAALNHANIVQIYEIGEHGGSPYFSMEYVDGGSLAMRLKASPFSDREAAELVELVATAVHYAHGRRVVHRDLKPANILLTSGGIPKVADFGLAKILSEDSSVTRTGGIVGTPSYMAPEQADGKAREIGPKIDVYALGAVLYELLTGRPPFRGETIQETLRLVVEQAPDPPRKHNPRVDRALEAVCLKCLEKEPKQRYESAKELALELERFRVGDPVQARPPGIGRRAVQVILRHQFKDVRPWGWITLLCGLVFGGGHLLNAWAIATEQSSLVLLWIALIGAVLYVVICVVALRGRTFAVGDRHGVSLIIGLGLACAMLLGVHPRDPGLDLTAYRLSLYPLLALLYGLGYFMMGAPSWGGFYVYGVALFVLALVMALAPPVGPVLFASFFGITQVWIGVYLLRFDARHR